MKIVVTGGRGFLGDYIVRTLTRTHEVEMTDRATLDVTDPSAVTRVLRGVRPDAVCHLAALCGAKASEEHPQEFFRVNAMGTVNLLEACRITGVRRFLLLSSLTVHGAGEEPMDEASSYAPRHPYAASKVAAEVTTKIYARCYGISSIILRPTLVVGKGYREGHAIGDLVETVCRGGTIQIYGTGRHRRDFIHPDDVASAVEASLERLRRADGSQSWIYNLSSGTPISMAELAERVIALAGCGSMVFGPATSQAFSLFTKIDRACQELSWRPRRDIDGIIQSVLTKEPVPHG